MKDLFTGLRWYDCVAFRMSLAASALGILVVCAAARCEEATPLKQAHAHNDYEHARPLLDALDQGFTSVEVDVYLVDGELLVAHDFVNVKEGQTIETLYLDPLAERVRQHEGSVYQAPVEFTLLVDLKSEAEATYAALNEKLAKYPELVTTWTNGERQAGPVTVIVSGNRPIATMAAQMTRRAGVDGRLADLELPAHAELMPLVSDRWGAHFAWDGQGAMPAEQRARLQEVVQRTHDRGQKLRFWATPDTPGMWGELRAAGVDLINTDDLPGLAKFLRNP